MMKVPGPLKGWLANSPMLILIVIWSGAFPLIISACCLETWGRSLQLLREQHGGVRCSSVSLRTHHMTCVTCATRTFATLPDDNAALRERVLFSRQIHTRNDIPDIPAGRSVQWPFVLFFAPVLSIQTEQTNQMNQNQTATKAPREWVYAAMRQSCPGEDLKFLLICYSIVKQTNKQRQDLYMDRSLSCPS